MFNFHSVLSSFEEKSFFVFVIYLGVLPRYTFSRRGLFNDQCSAIFVNIFLIFFTKVLFVVVVVVV